MSISKLRKWVSLLILIVLGGAYGLISWTIQAPVIWANDPFLIDVPPSSDKLSEHVNYLSGMEKNRSILHPESLANAAVYIEQEFGKMGYSITKQTVDLKSFVSYNLIAKFIPEQVSDDAPWIVVGAHYDAALEENPGADDNASGVAGILELARMFKNNQNRLKFPVMFVAYTTEEPPHFAMKTMGSFVHAKSMKEDQRGIRLMYSVEMIGYYSDELFSQKFPLGILYLFYPWAGDFIGIISNMDNVDSVRSVKKSFLAIDGLKTRSINAPPTLRGIDLSDHRSYWQFGVPAVMISDTAFFRNFEYHKPGDTADRLDYNKMALVVQGLFQSLNDLN